MVHRFSAATLVCLLLTAASAPADVEIRWKFKPDEKFYLEEVQKLNQTVEMMGSKQQQDMETTSVYSFTVKKADADSTVIEQKIESVRVTSKGPGLGGMEKISDKLKGTTFTITLNKKGEVEKFEGYDEMIKKITQGNDLVGKMMRAMLSEDVMKQSAGQAFQFLPDKEVKEGDKWERKMSVPLGPMGTFDSVNKYTLKSIKDDVAEITVEPTLTYQPPKGDNPLPFKITKGEFKADDAKGTIRFNIKKGRLERQEMALKLKGTMTIEIAGMETTMALDQDQRTTIRVSDKQP